ncbi:MAG: sensor domain-containing protein [Actinomycetota bacterium]|nr:sensor domain-containing protein [Actinomycetota bacterium]
MSLSWLLSPYTEAGTYRAIGYLLLGLPLGILSFNFVITGLALGLGLTVTLVGIPVLVATLLGARALAGFERELAATLLEAPMPRHIRAPHQSNGFWWHRLGDLLAERRTYAELGFLILRLPMGIADFVVVVTILSLALGAFAQPILIAVGIPTEYGSWTVDTYAEALVFVPISVVYLLAGPRLLLAWASVSRRFASAMLGQLEPRELKVAIAEVLARTGRADAFTILDQLGLRLGRGPFLSPTRVEANLLALQATGHVTSTREGSRTHYTLV